MTKQEVENKIKEILKKDKNFKDVSITIATTDKPGNSKSSTAMSDNK